MKTNQTNKVKKYHHPSGVIKNNGFTIIEVALVLAIAGLIFLVVFLALPALQNSQKDTARRQDVGRVVSALQSYEADNGGAVPNPTGWSWANSDGTSSTDTFGFGLYLGKLGSGVNGVSLAPATDSNIDIYAGTPKGGFIDVWQGRLCQSDSRAATSSDAAVVVWLSSGKVYCADM